MRPASAPEQSAGAPTVASKPRGRLETFVAPKPDARLIRALVPVNRVLNLAGVPGLRRAPVLRHVPGLRGLCDVVSIDFPKADQLRLRSAVNPHTAAFIAPNHPEFFTDWMLDKEVIARVSPLAACWATHVIVNGMGPLAQRFWLANNLIAQIPGAGDAGKEHSIAWAMTGNGVLLHPEGNVGWHGDWVAPIFPGAVEMAAEAARRLAESGHPRSAWVAPVVWKLRFLEDVRPGLAREADYVETRLGLAPTGRRDLGERLGAIYAELLGRDARTWSVADDPGLPFGERQACLARHMSERLAALTGQDFVAPADAEIDEAAAERQGHLLRRAERWLRGEGAASSLASETRRLVRDLRRLLRFRPHFYTAPELTQEHVAESLKRLRYDHCEGRLRDTLNRFVPRPAGARVAHIRVPEPIEVDALARGRPALDAGEIEAATADLRRRMQAGLDTIAATLPPAGGQPRFVNPWYRPRS